MKVYLKFNKTDTTGYVCLLFWLDIFKEYEIVLVCDLFDIKISSPPLLLKTILENTGKDIKILNTDYTLSLPYDDLILDKRYRRAAAANLTCFADNRNSNYFWLIDADDTIFLARDYSLIKEKLRLAETEFIKNRYDSLALDFYRMQNDTWSFGICLVQQQLDFSNLRLQLSDADFNVKDTRCLDICFDKLRRKSILNLKSFIINNTSFIHYVHKTKNLPYTLYHWENNKLNGVDVPGDFLKL